MSRITLGQVLVLIAVSLVGSLLIGQIYTWTFQLPAPAWLIACLLHSIVALPITFYWWKYDRRKFAFGRRIAYVPALLILIGSLSLAILTSTKPDFSRLGSANTAYLWASIFWVPVVEELVFRCGFSAILRRMTSPLWAGWFGSLVFAMAHTQPTWELFLTGQVGLALGAFLLGLVCESLLYWTQSILPSIALHAACNATVMIFGVLDARWLDWLKPLYL